jgi:hypothetical protein
VDNVFHLLDYMYNNTNTNNEVFTFNNIMTSCHDKESWWYTIQLLFSTKQITYFYKLDTTCIG